MKKSKKLVVCGLVAITLLGLSVSQAERVGWYFNVWRNAGTNISYNWAKNDDDQKAYVIVNPNNADVFTQYASTLGVRVRDHAERKMTSYHLIRYYGTFRMPYDQGRWGLAGFPYHLHGQVDSTSGGGLQGFDRVQVGGEWIN